MFQGLRGVTSRLKTGFRSGISPVPVSWLRVNVTTAKKTSTLPQRDSLYFLSAPSARAAVSAHSAASGCRATARDRAIDSARK